MLRRNIAVKNPHNNGVPVTERQAEGRGAANRQEARPEAYRSSTLVDVASDPAPEPPRTRRVSVGSRMRAAAASA